MRSGSTAEDVAASDGLSVNAECKANVVGFLEPSQYRVRGTIFHTSTTAHDDRIQIAEYVGIVNPVFGVDELDINPVSDAISTRLKPV